MFSLSERKIVVDADSILLFTEKKSNRFQLSDFFKRIGAAIRQEKSKRIIVLFSETTPVPRLLPLFLGELNVPFYFTKHLQEFESYVDKDSTILTHDKIFYQFLYDFPDEHLIWSSKFFQMKLRIKDLKRRFKPLKKNYFQRYMTTETLTRFKQIGVPKPRILDSIRFEKKICFDKMDPRTRRFFYTQTADERMKNLSLNFERKIDCINEDLNLSAFEKITTEYHFENIFNCINRSTILMNQVREEDIIDFE